MGPARTELRGGRNRDASRHRGRKDRAGRARRIRPDGGWCDRSLEPRIAPAVLNLTGGVLSYTAATGEVNALAVGVVQVSGTTYIRFQDTGTGVTIKPQGTGLVAESAASVRAPAASVTSISIDTEDRNDSVRLALGVGMPASISVNPDPPPDPTTGLVTPPAYGKDQLTIVGPAGSDTLALTSGLAVDATKNVVLADSRLGSKVLLQHMSGLTLDLSTSSGQHAVTVDRSITRPDWPLALKVIGGPSGTDSLTVTAPGAIPQSFTLTDGSVKTSDVRTGKEIMLGPDDNIAIDQPKVQVGLVLDPAAGDAGVWPQYFPDDWVLDTGASSILAASEATGDLESSGLYQTYPIQYLEQGVGGYTAMDVSTPYPFLFAGSDALIHTYELDNTKILSSGDLEFSFLGPWGIVGMPAMVNRFTNIDMSGWENPQSLDDPSIKTYFPQGADIPTNSGHWYQVPVKLVNFPEDGQQPGGPVPTSAPLAMIPVTIRDNGREVTSNFLLDTGAQLSMVSSDVAQALKLDLSHPSDTIDVGGVGGTVTVPLMPVDQLDVKASNGTSLAWTNLQVGVLDLTVPGGPTIGGVFGMDFLTSGWAAKMLPLLMGQPGSDQNGYFDHVYLDYRNSASGTGTIIFDVDPSHDTPAAPDPHAFSVSYSSIAAVKAVGGEGSDTLNVTPSPTIAYSVDGGTQPSGGADALQLVPGNPQATTNGSTITVPGSKAINYVNIESLNLGSSTYGPGPFKIWSGAATPQTADASDRSSVELGVRFTPSISGTITGVRFYKGPLNTGAHVADLWSSTGQLLATATFTNETASGWQQVNFSRPVAVTAGTTYVASYHTNVGQYAVNKSYFAAAYTSGPLRVPANGGVYGYGPAGTFPRNSYAGSNYWVDVVLSPTTAAAVRPGASGSTLAGLDGPAAPSAVGYGVSTDTATVMPWSSPSGAMTYQLLDAALRTAMLTRPVNRFESMLAQIAALRGHRLATLGTSPVLAIALPAAAAAPSQRPGDEPPWKMRVEVLTARVADPVQDVALSEIMALDPLFPKSKSKGLFS